MDNLDFIINGLIGILIIVGFFGYFAKTAHLYDEGGLLNRFWKALKAHFKKKKEAKEIKKEENTK